MQSAFALIVLFGLIGCGGESYRYQSERDIQAGPGLFSGEKEEIVLYQSKKAADESTRPSEEEKTE